MNDTSNESQADLLERGERRLNFWIVWAFAVFDLFLGIPSLAAPSGSAIEFVGGLGVMCQISLLSVWIGLGHDKLLERLFCVAPMYLLFAWYLATSSHFEPVLPSVVLALVLLYLIGAIIPYGLLRLLGVYCVRWGRSATWRNVHRRRRPVQFSLASLFKFTFVAACVAGILRLLHPRWEESIMDGTVFFLFSMFGLGGIWAALAVGNFARRAVVLYAASIVGGMATLKIVEVFVGVRVEYGGFCTRLALYLTTLLGILALYRRLGYRAVRGEPVAAGREPCDDCLHSAPMAE